MKLQADKKRSPMQFMVGEKVLLKLQPYAQTSVANRPYPKLSFKYYGPYEITERNGSVAYRLNLPEDSIIHPVFHISQLKQFHEDYTPVYAELPRVTDLALANTSPEAVLERRLVKKGNVAIPQVKVKWAGLHEDCATWEDLYVVKTRFPSSSVWGQPQISAGGDVTTVEKPYTEERRRR